MFRSPFAVGFSRVTSHSYRSCEVLNVALCKEITVVRTNLQPDSTPVRTTVILAAGPSLPAVEFAIYRRMAARLITIVRVAMS